MASGTTKRSDLIIPEVFAEAVAGAFADGMMALDGSTAVIENGTLPDSVRGGDTVKIPYFGTLGELEEPAAEGDPLTPEKLSATNEEAEVSHAGKAFELTKWAEIAANFLDPYAEAARQIKAGARRWADRKLIDTAFDSLPGGMIKDVYSAGSPVTLDYPTVVDAKMLFGDEQAEIALLVVHSKVLGDLLKLTDSTGRPMVVPDMNNGDLLRFVNIPLRVSDRLNPDGANYSSLILKRGALALWYNGEPRMDEDKDILSDTRITALHVYAAAHRYARLPGLNKGGVVEISHN